MARKQYNDDDGRQIADLSGLDSPRFTWRKRREGEQAPESPLSTLSPSETRGVVFSALAAGLVVGGIFIAGAAIFISICLLIW